MVRKRVSPEDAEIGHVLVLIEHLQQHPAPVGAVAEFPQVREGLLRTPTHSLQLTADRDRHVHRLGLEALRRQKWDGITNRQRNQHTDHRYTVQAT